MWPAIVSALVPSPLRRTDSAMIRYWLRIVYAVLTSFWRVPGMAADSGTPTHWLHGLSNLVVNVHCVCSPETAAKRFVERKRHAGHLDGHSTYADVLTSLQALATLGTLDVGPRLDVDTSGPVTIDNVVREIRRVFTRDRSSFR